MLPALRHAYSSLKKKKNLGDIDATGDEKYEHYAYAVNSSAWIVDRVSNYSLYADDNATLARQTLYYYDSSGYGALGSQGALSKVERWLDTELANPTTEYTYDEHGNVKTETDALGLSETAHRTKKPDVTLDEPVEPLQFFRHNFIDFFIA